MLTLVGNAWAKLSTDSRVTILKSGYVLRKTLVF